MVTIYQLTSDFSDTYETGAFRKVALHQYMEHLHGFILYSKVLSGQTHTQH